MRRVKRQACAPCIVIALALAVLSACLAIEFARRPDAAAPAEARTDAPLRLPDPAYTLPTAQPTAIAAPLKHCTICVVLRNEIRFLREWLEFHHAVGFTRVWIYDDHSTDGWESMLPAHPYVTRIPVDWKYKVPSDGQHKQRILQVDAYTRCLTANWNTSSLIAVMDVDEFFFPARQSWPHADLMEASLQATKARHQLTINRRSKPVKLDPPGCAPLHHRQQPRLSRAPSQVCVCQRNSVHQVWPQRL